MKQNIIISIGLLAGACTLSQSNAIAQDEIRNLKNPSSWNQYLDSVVESGDLGTWRAGGVTKDLWVGIPAGIRYVSNDTRDISHDRKKLLIAHEMIAENGKMLSIGSGFVGWDPIEKRIYSFYSGYDGGKPFWGPRELVGFSSEGEVWKYTETSRGDTYETLIVYKRTSNNSRVDIVKRTDGTGDIQQTKLIKIIDEKGDTRPATREDFIRYTKAVQGMWKGEVLSVIGDSSLGRTGDSYTAYWNSYVKSPSCSTSSFNGGEKSHDGLTIYDANLKKIMSISSGNDGTVTRSYYVPKGDNWYRETVHTKADGQISKLKSDIKIDVKKGVMTILISGKVGSSSLKNQKNVWYRQHK
jgi:hypothetical protein